MVGMNGKLFYFKIKYLRNNKSQNLMINFLIDFCIKGLTY